MTCIALNVNVVVGGIKSSNYIAENLQYLYPENMGNVWRGENVPNPISSVHCLGLLWEVLSKYYYSTFKPAQSRILFKTLVSTPVIVFSGWTIPLYACLVNLSYRQMASSERLKIWICLAGRDEPIIAGADLLEENAVLLIRGSPIKIRAVCKCFTIFRSNLVYHLI